MRLLALGVTLLTSPLVMAGISGTKHNLGSTGTQAPAVSADTNEICVFCHTPHSASLDAVVPLWNKNLSDPGTYQTYDTLGTSTLDGQVAQIGSVSIACLSCHDGAQAMDVMINEPGSGLDTLTGSLGAMSPGVANLGTDLRTEHPIGIQYGGYDAGGGQIDPDFIVPQTLTINTVPIWWVDTTNFNTGGIASNPAPNGEPLSGDITGASAVREKTDMQLYTRTNAVGASGGTISGSQPFVECASCHDPHSSENPTFLRINNVGSEVCLACHNK